MPFCFFRHPGVRNRGEAFFHGTEGGGPQTGREGSNKHNPQFFQKTPKTPFDPPKNPTGFFFFKKNSPNPAAFSPRIFFFKLKPKQPLKKPSEKTNPNHSKKNQNLGPHPKQKGRGLGRTGGWPFGFFFFSPPPAVRPGGGSLFLHVN